MKIFYVTFLSLFFTTSAWSQESRKEIGQNVNLAGSNYLAYPVPTKPLTPAPKGKKPFYISHYGRHGSRFLIDRDDYYKTLDIFCSADSAGKLTDMGKEVMSKVRLMCRESDKRYGELTELGAQ